MAEDKKAKNQELSLSERIGNLLSGVNGSRKTEKMPECGAGNLCCHIDCTPRIVVVGHDDAATKSFHEKISEASDRCTTPLLVDLSFDMDAQSVSGHTSPILPIKGDTVSDGVDLETDEIEALLVKAGFNARWEV